MGWRLAGRLGPDHGDPVFYVYLLKWVASRIPHGLAGLWDPPFFHPLPGVLALSDHFLGPGFAFALLRALGLAPLEAYNLLYASAFAFAGVACWWVLRRSGISWLGAAFGAWFFAFGHFRWDDQSHFNVLRIAWIPLVLWTFDRLLAAPSGRRAAAFSLCYAAHLAGSVYFAYLIHFPLAALALNRRQELAGLRREPLRGLPLAAAAAVALALLAALFAGYSGRAEQLNAERKLYELRDSAPVLASFKGVSAHAPIESLLPALRGPQPRGSLFPGIAVLAAASAAALSGWRWFRRPVRRPAGAVALLTTAAGALVFAAGLVAEDAYTRAPTSRLDLFGVTLHDYRVPLIALLAGGGLIWAVQRRLRAGAVLDAASIPGWPRGLLLMGALSIAACLPAVFWLLWKNLPGMQGMRIPHRFFPFAALALAFAAGAGLDLLRRRVRSPALRAAVVALFASILVLEQLPALRRWTPYPEEPDFPAYTRYLAQTAEVRSYAELPMFGDWHDLTTMYLGTTHWKPLVNGSSSFLPYDREVLARECSRLAPGCLERLREWDVSHLVARYWMGEDVRGKLRRKADRREFLSWGPRLAELERAGLLVPVFRDGQASVYRLDWERGGETAAPAGAGQAGAAIPGPSVSGTRR